MAVNLHTTQYRFGIDELAESTHGWYAAQNTNPTANAIGPGKTFLLRFNVQETGGTAAGNTDFQFRVALNGGGFQNITTSSTIVKAVDPAAWADAANCTQRVAGTGTFESSGAGCTIDGLSGGAANDIAASGCSETECGLQIVAADVKVGDTITFDLTSPDFTITNDVVPTLTLTAPPEAARESSSPAVTARSFPQNRNQNLLSWALNLLQSTLAPVAEVAYQLRGAVFSNPRRHQWRPESVFAVGLLLTTLAVVQDPFVQRAWPNPTAPARSHALATWTQGPNPEGIVNKFRLGPYDHPNPSLGPARASVLRTWTQGPNPDSLVPLPDPFHQTSWPRPGAWRAQLTWAQGQNPDAIPNTDLPSGHPEQPVAVRAVPRLQPETWVYSASLALGVPVQSPPLPAGTQFDFPNPKIAQRGQGFTRELNLVQTFPQPFKQTDWPLPITPRRAFQSVIGANFQVLTFTAPAGLPDGKSTEWLVPKGPDRSKLLRTSLAGVLSGEETFPASQTDWPNPRIPARALQGITQGLNLPQVRPQPFNQTAWPNPTLRDRSIDLRTIAGSVTALNFPPPPSLPAGQISHTSDFPVPRGASRSASLLAGFIDSNRTANEIPTPVAGSGYYDIWHYYTGH